MDGHSNCANEENLHVKYRPQKQHPSRLIHATKFKIKFCRGINNLKLNVTLKLRHETLSTSWQSRLGEVARLSAHFLWSERLRGAQRKPVTATQKHIVFMTPVT